MSNDLQIIEIVQNMNKNIINRLDTIENKIDNLVDKDECKEQQKNCSNKFNLDKEELSIKKITAIGGIVAATITASATAITILVKVFFPI